MFANGLPALVLLALDVCLARLPLGVERVEGLLETLFGGLSGVDGAANRRFVPVLMGGPRFLSLCFRPKNSGPDQRVPVISRAISERLL